MPGIYVRKTSWINLMQQRENLVLTVPGSYWLCHKCNIYKFIFRYHRTIRSLKNFNHGRELMKIIRRIIKNPPRQGQQFSTQNLLVTYGDPRISREKLRSKKFIAVLACLASTLVENNSSLRGNTSWTRQDKIFAMTKFKERSAAAFSHAFVLTIKVLSFLESSKQAIKYNATTCSDEVLSWNDNELVHPLDNELPEHSDQKSDTLNKMSTNSTNKELVHYRQKLKHSKAANEKSRRESNCTVSDKYSALPTVEEDRLISNQSEDENIKNEDYGNKAEKAFIQNNIAEFDNNDSDLSNADSANLPYQYLIEREIEDAKVGTTNPKVSLSDSKKRKRQNSSETCSTASLDLLADVSETDESESSAKRKRGLGNITPRSSDITDLVMEGLMFTIRQGQDTVAVIEQKTKLELDEVLENSEKIETVKGEKYLRNSSLLGLENLITMIESPTKTETKQKPQNLVTQENTAQFQSIRKRTFINLNYSFEDSYFNNMWLNKNNNSPNKNQNTKIHEKDTKLTENKGLHYKSESEEEEIEEEDIIPEVLQDSRFETSDLSLKELDTFEEDAVNKDLLMDDADSEILTKFGVKSAQDPLLGKKHELHHKDVADETNKKNGPIIISNEIIATGQIPLQIQKLLQNKSPRKRASGNSTNERKHKEIVDHRPQLLECENGSCKVHSGIENSDSNILESSQSLANLQTSVSSDNEIRNEGASYLILDNQCKNSDVIENRLEESEDEPQKQPVKKEDHKLRLCKLQNVTQEFYRDILYLQRKKNLANQRLNLRSRKNSVNTLQDTNTRDAHIEMLKFFHDITKGAKVVVTRMSTKSIHSLIAKNS